MPLRPIDAIFVHPERRLYVIYFRGKLWQLPRMKIDTAAWERRQPYHGDTNALYLSRNQNIADPALAQQLRTLNLPIAVQGSTLPKFESWWEVHGFAWLTDLLKDGKSPLAAHQADTPSSEQNVVATTTDQPTTSIQPMSEKSDNSSLNNSSLKSTEENHSRVYAKNDLNHTQQTDSAATTDIFADMLAELTKEVLDHRR